ncbi:hypothetical protein CUJ88_42620 [Paraburkholderia hospita]|nr:hypothetical protein CUJ88_42620 [Paraburkholderia hospita]
MNILGHRKLHRPATSSLHGATCVERTSADFLIDHRSLLELLVQRAGGHSDFMGCFVNGYVEECQRARTRLLGISLQSGTESRVLLYICPECGDVGCGAYSAVVRRDATSYLWRSFAYQTSERDLNVLDMPGPFVFEASHYETAVLAAAAFDAPDGGCVL